MKNITRLRNQSFFWLISFLTIFSAFFFLFNPFDLCKAQSLQLRNFEPEWLGTNLEYYSNDIAINIIDGADLGPNSQCYISFNFWNNESGNYIENEILILDSQNTQQFSQTEIFLINYSTLELSFLNGTRYGKTHLFMDPNRLIINHQSVIVSTYNNEEVTGTVYYDSTDVLYILNEQLIDYSEIRVKFEKNEVESEYSLLYEKETGVLVYFIPAFLSLKIFQLFNIEYAVGPPFQLINSDFVFPYLDPEEFDPEAKNSNFDYTLLLILGSIIGIFGIVFYFVSKNRSPKRKSFKRRRNSIKRRNK